MLNKAKINKIKSEIKKTEPVIENIRVDEVVVEVETKAKRGKNVKS